MIRRLVITILVIAALAPVLSGDAAPPALISQGVTLAGVPVGGMSNEQAQAALKPAFARPVRLVYGARRWRLVPAHFGAKVYRTVVPRTVRISEAPSFGQPVTVFDSTSRGALAYRELAKEVSRGATRRAG